MLQVLSCLDDDNQSTRLVTSKVLQLLLLAKPSSITGISLTWEIF